MRSIENIGPPPVTLHAIRCPAQGLADHVAVLLDAWPIQPFAQLVADHERLLEALSRGDRIAPRRLYLAVDVERLGLSVRLGHGAAWRGIAR